MFTNFEIMPSSSKPKVCFFFENVKISLNNRSGLKKFIESIFRKEKKKLKSLNYIFCKDSHLLKINQEYLNHDFYTDIISFDLSEKEGGVLGEIYISIDRVRENSKKLGIPLSKELRRVIFHGALHLCGYRDNTYAEIIRMRKVEEYYLNIYLQVSRDTVSC